MNQKQIKYCKAVYERMMNGTYDPIELQTAFEHITGNKEPVQIRVKRGAIYNYFQNIYVENGEENHRSDNDPKMGHSEEVKMEKPETTKKKTVTKRRRRTKKNDE